MQNVVASKFVGPARESTLLVDVVCCTEGQIEKLVAQSLHKHLHGPRGNFIAARHSYASFGLSYTML